MKTQKLVIVLVVVVALAIVAYGAWVTHSTKDTQKSSRTTSLQIKEWGVVVPLTPTIADAYYTYDASSGEAYISTRHLEALLSGIHGCTTGLHGLYYKKTTDKLPTLVEQHRIEPLCVVPANDETVQIGTIQTSIRTAVRAAALN